MVKEIDNDTARLLAGEISRSFAQNPNGRLGQVQTLVDIHKTTVNVLDYDSEDLLNNPIIRERLFGDFRKVQRHPHRLKKSENNLERAFKKELDQGLKRARNSLET